MEAIISAISDIFTAAMGWAGTVASTVVATPLLLFGVTVGFVGLGVGLFRRLLHTR